MVEASSPLDISEDTYVLAASGKVIVTEMSGCTAVFLWDEKNHPSVFHILCGDETKKAWVAIDKVQRKAKAFTIVASDQKRYNNAKKEITEYAENEAWPALHEEHFPLYKLDPTNKKWHTFTATAGSRSITTGTMDNPHDC
jgi:hypothetical protein